MEETLGGVTRPVNMEDELISAMREFRQLVAILRPLAEKCLASPHFWESPGSVLTDRADKEAQAIVLLSQMDRPTMAAIARKLKVPRTTLQKWPNFAKAWDRAHGSVRDVRRGHRDANGDIDSAD